MYIIKITSPVNGTVTVRYFQDLILNNGKNKMITNRFVQHHTYEKNKAVKFFDKDEAQKMCNYIADGFTDAQVIGYKNAPSFIGRYIAPATDGKMSHLKNIIIESATNTSFHMTGLSTTVNELIGILGAPTYECNDGSGKVNFEWVRKNAQGEVFTVYDWKEDREIELDEEIDFHIGGTNKESTDRSMHELQVAIDNLPLL